MIEQTFTPKAKDELICLILHAQHLINAQTLYRQDVSEQFEQIFQPEGDTVTCPISDEIVKAEQLEAWLNDNLNSEQRAELGDITFVAIGTILQLWAVCS
ncbi:hypothetical protein [Ferrimonas lipolytica]|uniref:Uncharacterized protein n=1 Tax=Ferrimonas lipolytica TaxID=2724191 RepID=A0A6H1UBQ5_9GAMM|nr:hypothetical protein [Ferrimonas lipolytica]QIZ76491.1 hypothetical protein HER31_06210 [Ferrimonas lipolytica]